MVVQRGGDANGRIGKACFTGGADARMIAPASGPQRKDSAVSDYQFERESRTPFSEAYTVEAGGDVVARADIHFTPSGIVYATLCVPQDFDEEDIQDLIGEIDERLVLSTDAYRDDFVVTVWRGVQAGVYSEEDDEADEDEEADEEGEDAEAVCNGRTPA